MILTEDTQLFRQHIVGKPALLGLDVGSKRIGMAISPAGWIISSPLGSIQRRSDTELDQELSDIIKQRLIQGIVVGYPRHMDGSVGDQAHYVTKFCHTYLEKLEMPVLLWDERWSSQAIERQMIAHNVSRKKRQKKIDEGAAAYILQGAIDCLHIMG